MLEVGGDGQLWLFDENFGEHHPTFCHDRSGTHMHMKNLELALSASQTLGREFLSSLGDQAPVRHMWFQKLGYLFGVLFLRESYSWGSIFRFAVFGCRDVFSKKP